MSKKHDLLTIQEVSEELRLSRNSVHTYINRGWINRIRIGGKVFVKREEVEYIKENGTPSIQDTVKW